MVECQVPAVHISYDISLRLQIPAVYGTTFSHTTSTTSTTVKHHFYVQRYFVSLEKTLNDDEQNKK